MEDGKVKGIFEISGPNFGNLWANIPLPYSPPMKVAVAVSQGGFSERYNFAFDPEWEVEFGK